MPTERDFSAFKTPIGAVIKHEFNRLFSEIDISRVDRSLSIQVKMARDIITGESPASIAEFLEGEVKIAQHDLRVCHISMDLVSDINEVFHSEFRTKSHSEYYIKKTSALMKAKEIFSDHQNRYTEDEFRWAVRVLGISLLQRTGDEEKVLSCLSRIR